jgi:hypothetical protein
MQVGNKGIALHTQTHSSTYTDKIITKDIIKKPRIQKLIGQHLTSVPRIADLVTAGSFVAGLGFGPAS